MALQTKVDSLVTANDSIRIMYRDRINLVHEALADFLDEFDSKLYDGSEPDFRWSASRAMKMLEIKELK
ncbi:MAG: hypothetical protein IJ151_01300 [Bacteroidales bacterium]|nr:hypothetical protein [Bacteroidales bacterium]